MSDPRETRGVAPLMSLNAYENALQQFEQAVHVLGLTPNQDVYIAGYDNYWSSCWEREFEPTAPVATVDKFNRASGSRMVRMLLELPSDNKRRKPELCRIKPRLIITGRTDATSSLL